MKIALLIRSLEIGGAERQLAVLARGLHEYGHEVLVITFYPGGPLRGDLDRDGIPVVDMAKRGRWDLFAFIWRVIVLLRAEQPNVIYSFLPSANIVALIAGRLARVPRVVWGVRAANMDLSKYDRLSRIELLMSSRLARFANRVICNSSAGAEHHYALGYSSSKLGVIENGIDTDRFAFDRSGRLQLRQEWKINEHDFLVGLAARLDPMKGHSDALHAFADFVTHVPKAKLALVGGGPMYSQLQALSARLGLSEKVYWIGERVDMPAVYSAFDLALSASHGEGFSNTVAEAMACQQLCVVTDVGDSAKIVGETGWVVPAMSSALMSKAMLEVYLLSTDEREIRRRDARRRILRHFSVKRMVERTLDALST